MPTGLEAYDGTLKMTMEEVVKQRHHAADIVKPHLTWADNGGAVIALTERLMIGKGDQAHVVVRGGLFTGKIHCHVIEDKGQHAVFPETWWTKVTVNGRSVPKDGKKLVEGDKIGVGASEFVYHKALFT